LLELSYKGQLDSEADEFIHYAASGVTRTQELINLQDRSHKSQGEADDRMAIQGSVD
jgi:hypothetical protein